MRKTLEILRLKFEVGLTNRQIARSCGLSHPTVGQYLERAAAAGISWPVADDLEQDRLEQLLFPVTPDATARAQPDWAQVHQELRHPYVTLRLVWEEYRVTHPDGYGYTQFCEHYKRWKAPLEVTLRQHHVAGDKPFLDWAGKTLSWTDPDSGQPCPAFLFVAALGASDYTFAHAYADQRLPSWIEAHIELVEYCGGVTRLWVPDNTKTGVDQPCYYEPVINPTYQELADHYHTAILPTRTYAARDKAKVESAVLQAERRILARLRHQTFFSLAELNRAVRTCLTEINQRPFQKMPGSRLELFQQLDQPALRPVPTYRYELGEWGHAKANIDYHVQVDWHFYSVPYTLTLRQVEYRLSAHTVELYYRGRRVAAHVRSRLRGGFTTDPGHRPKAHQKHLEWTPGRLIEWAQQIGPQCGQAVRHLLASKPHPEQGYRSCLGIIRLARTYGHDRLEAACRRALALDACTYQSLKSILKTKLDQQPLPPTTPATPPTVALHDNLRGQRYYQLPQPDRQPTVDVPVASHPQP